MHWKLCMHVLYWNSVLYRYTVLVLSVTHGNPSLMEISPSDEQFWPIYPSLAEIPRVTDSTSDVCKISHSWNLEVLVVYGRSI